MAVISGGKVIEGALFRVGSPLAGGEGAAAGSGMRIAKASYSFAVEGGAAGAIGLMGVTGIPTGSIIWGGFVEVTTPLAGAGSVALGVEGAADLVASAAVAGAPWSTVGRKNVIPAASGTTSLKTTAARDVTATIAGGTVTAGVFDVYLFYLPGVD